MDAYGQRKMKQLVLILNQVGATDAEKQHKIAGLMDKIYTDGHTDGHISALKEQNDGE